VTFEGVCGEDYHSDIAIDDIQFLNGTHCKTYAESAGTTLNNPLKT
jgi:hypothetical protein